MNLLLLFWLQSSLCLYVSKYNIFPQRSIYSNKNINIFQLFVFAFNESILYWYNYCIPNWLQRIHPPTLIFFWGKLHMQTVWTALILCVIDVINFEFYAPILCIYLRVFIFICKEILPNKYYYFKCKYDPCVYVILFVCIIKLNRDMSFLFVS